MLLSEMHKLYNDIHAHLTTEVYVVQYDGTYKRIRNIYKYDKVYFVVFDDHKITKYHGDVLVIRM